MAEVSAVAATTLAVVVDVVVVAAVVVVVVPKPTLLPYTHPKPFRIFAELDEWPGLLWFRPPSEHDKAGAEGMSRRI